MILKECKVAVTTTTFGDIDGSPLELLRERGIRIVKNTFGRKLKPGEVIAICRGCSGIIAGTENYDRTTLKELTGLKVLSRVGVGIDAIDLEAAKELGITVLNTPDGPTQAVSELTIGLMLNLLRYINSSDRDLKKGIWKKNMGSLLNGKNVGIIGFGRIGRKVAELARCFGAQPSYNDIYGKKAGLSCEFKEFAEIIMWADIITLHCPELPGNNALFGNKELRRMKQGAFLINTARGSLVDAQALYDNLRDKHLAGAALDVFTDEPYSGALTKLDTVILTPHIGAYARESRIEMELQAVRNLIERLENLQ
ncbi:MAG: phosphoglycerate dehydrogenase [Candidatus Omnitrophica bacterium]|nr:phosphoglycerate dehydrogenase [Candidatus Omnitrophota bacterium]